MWIIENNAHLYRNSHAFALQLITCRQVSVLTYADNVKCHGYGCLIRDKFATSSGPCAKYTVTNLELVCANVCANVVRDLWLPNEKLRRGGNGTFVGLWGDGRWGPREKLYSSCWPTYIWTGNRYNMLLAASMYKTDLSKRMTYCLQIFHRN